MRALIDTCVIIDALQNREPFAQQARQIFINAANMTFDGFITAKSAADIYYIIHRALHSDVETRKALDKIFMLFDVADTTAADCRMALISKMSDYEDAVMSETAARIGADYIVTRNLEDYKKSVVAAISPSSFLEILDGEEF